MASFETQAVEALEFDALVNLFGDGLLSRTVTLVVAVVAAAVACHLVTRVLRRGLDQSRLPSVSIFVNIVRVLVWSFAVMSVLEPVFGIRPTAVVAALGVTSLVITLGMQDTVSNVIGGLGLMLGKVVQPGDKVDVSGFRGTVTDVNWRSTTVVDRAGNRNVIPNSILNKASLTNLTVHDAAQIEVPLVVRHGADLLRVEACVVEAARRALGDHLVPGEPTEVRFSAVDVYGIRCSVFVYVKVDLTAPTARELIVRQLSGEDWLARSSDAMAG